MEITEEVRKTFQGLIDAYEGKDKVFLDLLTELVGYAPPSEQHRLHLDMICAVRDLSHAGILVNAALDLSPEFYEYAKRWEAEHCVPITHVVLNN